MTVFGQVSDHVIIIIISCRLTLTLLAVLDINETLERHTSQTSIWAKGQSKVVATIKEKHGEEKQTHKKQIDNLRRVNTSVESERAQCKRDLQSCQQRCSTLENVLGSLGNDHTNTVEKFMHTITDTETKLEASHSTEKESRDRVFALEEQVASLRGKSKETEASHSKNIEGLRVQLISMQGMNQKLSARISFLEDEAEKALQIHMKEKQAIQQATEQKVREVSTECEALRVVTKNEITKTKHRDDLLEKQSVLHESALNQISAAKKVLTAKMEKEINDEREVGQCLMSKVQELHEKIQMLTAETYRCKQENNKSHSQIDHLEKIIANGEVRLSQLGTQLSLSMQDQQRRIVNEAELKKELNKARLEVQGMKRDKDH